MTGMNRAEARERFITGQIHDLRNLRSGAGRGPIELESMFVSHPFHRKRYPDAGRVYSINDIYGLCSRWSIRH